MDKAQLLRQVGILQSLSHDEITRLSTLVEAGSYAAGDVVIRDGAAR